MKVALVTGGATRIGQQLSLALGKLGYSLIVHYHKQSPQKTSELLINNQVPHILLYADLAEMNQLQKMFEQAILKFQKIDVLINNASVFGIGNIKNTSLAIWEEQFNLNLRAPFFLSQLFADKIGEGQIINLLDSQISKNSSNYVAYLLSKKSLGEFTKLAAKEFAPKIRVNALAPGIILAKEGWDENEKIKFINKNPLKRQGIIKELIQGLEYLVKNEYVTGQIIFIDGGQSLN